MDLGEALVGALAGGGLVKAIDFARDLVRTRRSRTAAATKTTAAEAEAEAEIDVTAMHSMRDVVKSLNDQLKTFGQQLTAERDACRKEIAAAQAQHQAERHALKGEHQKCATALELVKAELVHTNREVARLRDQMRKE